jgi:hypothetical protein
MQQLQDFTRIFDITLLVHTKPKILTGFFLSFCRGQIKEGPLSSWRNREKRLKIERNMWCTVYRSQEGGGGRGEAPHSSVPPEIGPGPEQQGTTPLLLTVPIAYWVAHGHII